jgi:serine/threonine protein kinase
MIDLKPGDWIAGEYRIRRVFGGRGKSGMGIVYLVEGRSSEEPFVLKTFQAGPKDSEFSRRFEKEAMTWVDLGKHPNLVECFWARRYKDQLFVAAEYIWPDLSGRNTLAQHIRSGPVPLEKQTEWISQCCFAMRHALKRGLVAHRDFKPENMMIDGAGCLKLTDFGLARVSQEEQLASASGLDKRRSGRALTLIGSAFGTPGFMAPEQFLDSASVDHRADIYGLGVVIFMLMTQGRLPIQSSDPSGSVASWMAAHGQQRIRFPDSPLTAIATRCLEKDPRRRFQTFDDLLDALSTICRKKRVDIPLEGKPADVEFLSQYSKAQTFAGTGKILEAERLLRTMIARWPNRSIVLTELSRVLIASGRWADGILAARRSLEICPSSSAAWNNLGAALGHLRKIEEAQEAYSNALLVDPENTGAMMSIADLYLKDGKLNEARKAAELAYFWRPEKLPVLRLLGECYLRCREAGKAADVFRKLIARDPSDSAAWFNLALCHQIAGAVEKQIEALGEVLKRKPDDGKAANALVQVYIDAGQIDHAIRATHGLQKIAGNEIVAIAKRAQLYVAKDEFILGYSELTNALGRHKRSAALWFAMAAILRSHPQHRGQAATAIQNAILCAKESPNQLIPENLDLLRRWAADLA